MITASSTRAAAASRRTSVSELRPLSRARERTRHLVHAQAVAAEKAGAVPVRDSRAGDASASSVTARGPSAQNPDVASVTRRRVTVETTVASARFSSVGPGYGLRRSAIPARRPRRPRAGVPAAARCRRRRAGRRRRAAPRRRSRAARRSAGRRARRSRRRGGAASPVHRTPSWSSTARRVVGRAVVHHQDVEVAAVARESRRRPPAGSAASLCAGISVERARTGAAPDASRSFGHRARRHAGRGVRARAAGAGGRSRRRSPPPTPDRAPGGPAGNARAAGSPYRRHARTPATARSTASPSESSERRPSDRRRRDAAATRPHPGQRAHQRRRRHDRMAHHRQRRHVVAARRGPGAPPPRRCGRSRTRTAASGSPPSLPAIGGGFARRGRTAGGSRPRPGDSSGRCRSRSRVPRPAGRRRASAVGRYAVLPVQTWSTCSGSRRSAARDRAPSRGAKNAVRAVRGVAALHGADARIVEARGHAFQPVALERDVLIDLRDDRDGAPRGRRSSLPPRRRGAGRPARRIGGVAGRRRPRSPATRRGCRRRPR